MWYVYADRETRRRRLMENRGYSEEKIRSIFAKQLLEEGLAEEGWTLETMPKVELTYNTSDVLKSVAGTIL